MTMTVPVLIILAFLAGFVLHNHRAILIVVIIATVLGVLIADSALMDVVHTLGGALSSLS